jgi:hypothetical protein
MRQWFWILACGCILAAAGMSAERENNAAAEFEKLPDGLRADFAARFTGFKVVRIEHKYKFHFYHLFAIIDLPTEHTTEIVFVDAAGKEATAKYEDGLRSIKSFNVEHSALPEQAAGAIAAWAPDAVWNRTARGSKELGQKMLYKVEGKLHGKTIKAEIFEDGQFKKQDKLPAAKPETRN